MHIKTRELTGPALDWAVAQITGVELNIIETPNGPYIGIKGRTPDGFPKEYSPSKDWALGGPLVEELYVSLSVLIPAEGTSEGWYANVPAASRLAEGRCHTFWHSGQAPDATIGAAGGTPLEAAMRAVVALKNGLYTQVPDDIGGTHGDHSHLPQVRQILKTDDTH